jgi:uncharacterized repeat protein (TIGR01451 family)
MKQKPAQRAWTMLLILTLTLPQLIRADMTDPGGNITLSEEDVSPVGGFSSADGVSLESGSRPPAPLLSSDYEKLYDEAQKLYDAGYIFRTTQLQILPATTIEEALHNYADFNDGVWFKEFCFDYDQITADGYCPPPSGAITQTIRNDLFDGLKLFGVLATAPVNAMMRVDGQPANVRETGARGALDAAREIANIHLIFGNEFLVDATDYRFSAGAIPNAEEIISTEISELEQAAQQFELAMDILSYAFTTPLNGRILYAWQEPHYLGEYFGEREFETFGVASGRLVTTLGEIAARYRQLGQDEKALAIYNEAFTTQYLLTLALAQDASERNADYLTNGSWDMLNNLARMRAQAQAIQDGLNPFGYGAEYVPLHAYDTLRAKALELWGYAGSDEQDARTAQREFDTNYTELVGQLADLTGKYDDQLLELCGPPNEHGNNGYEYCNGGLMKENYHDWMAARLRVELAQLRVQNVVSQTIIEQERSGGVINVTLGTADAVSAELLAKGVEASEKTVNTTVESTEDRSYKGAEGRVRAYAKAECTVSTKNLGTGSGCSATAGVEVSGEGWLGEEWSTLNVDSTETVYDPEAEALAQFDANIAYLEALRDAGIEGANSEAAIRNLLLRQAELMQEIKIAVEEQKKLADEHNHLLQKFNYLLNQRQQAEQRMVDSYLNNPAYRIVRDNLTVQAAESVDLAAQYAFLAARAAEYDFVTEFPGVGDIFKVRTARDVRNFLTALDGWYLAVDRPGQLNRYPYTISLAKDILGLTDQNLDPDGSLSPQQIAQLRYTQFQGFLQQNILENGTLKFQFVTSLDHKIMPTQYLFSPNIWNNRIAGLDEPLAGAQGVGVNILTHQSGIVYRPEVVLTHGGHAAYRTYDCDSEGRNCVIKRYDPGPSMPVGYQVPAGLNPVNTTVVIKPQINGAGGERNGGLVNLSVAATGWTFRIPGDSLGDLDLSQVEDIQLLVDSTGRAIPINARAAERDARWLQAQFDGQPLPLDEPLGGFEGLPLEAASNPNRELSVVTAQAAAAISPPMVLAGNLPALVDDGQLSGHYVGTVGITNPLASILRVGFVLFDLNGVLSGTLDVTRTQAYSEPLALHGISDGSTFTLTSEIHNGLVAGQPVQRSFRLVGQPVADGNTLRGFYTEVITGLLPALVVAEGGFSVSRPALPGRGSTGSSLAMQVEPSAIPTNGSAVVTITLFIGGAAAPPTRVNFTSDLGMLSSPTITTSNGIAIVTFNAGSTPGQATITATNGTLTSTAHVNIVDPSLPVDLSVQAEREIIAIGSSTVISAFLANGLGQPIAASTRVTFTVSEGTVSPPAADTDANGVAIITFTAAITPGLATVQATNGSFTNTVQVRAVDPTVPTNLQVEANRTAIATAGDSTAILASVINALGEVLTPTTRITFTTDLGTLSSRAVDTGNTGLPGYAQVRLDSGSVSGLATIHATNGSFTSTVRVNIVDPAVPAQVQVEVRPASIPARGSASITVTLFNGLGGLVETATDVEFTTDLGTVTPQVVATTNGVAVATFNAGSTAGLATIRAGSGNVYGTAYVRIGESAAALQVVKTRDIGGLSEVPLGGVVTYTIVISNSGGSVATSVVMTDPLPSGVTFGTWVEQGTGTVIVPLQTVAWGPADVAAHTAYTISFTVNVTSSTDFVGSTITNTATVTASNAANVLTATAAVTVADVAIAGLTATNDGPTILGQATTLTATITAGSSVAYAWAFGDGEFGSSAVTTHTYSAAGLYTATITASNSVSLLTATTTVSIVAADYYYIYLPLTLRNQ